MLRITSRVQNSSTQQFLVDSSNGSLQEFFVSGTDVLIDNCYFWFIDSRDRECEASPHFWRRRQGGAENEVKPVP